MDQARLDDIARVLGSGQSRRRALRTLAGAALGLLAASVGFDAVDAARKRAQGGMCSKNADCVSGICLPRDRTGRRLYDCAPNPTQLTCGTQLLVCKPTTAGGRSSAAPVVPRMAANAI